MSDGDLSGEQRAYRDAARDLVMGRGPIAARDLLPDLGRLGFLGLPLPASVGGEDADLLTACVAIEVFGAADPVLARGVADAIFLGVVPIALLATPSQRRRLLPPLLRGAATAALAREPGTVSPSSGGWVLDAPVSALDGWLPAALEVRPVAAPDGLALVVLPISPPGAAAPAREAEAVDPEALLGPAGVPEVLAEARTLHGIATAAAVAAGDGPHRALARRHGRVVVIGEPPRDH